jgi:MYXO-CTERM domain-containing protein
MRFRNAVRTGVLMAAMAVLPLAAQQQPATANQPSSIEPPNAPKSNPGFGPQVPNDVTGYAGPQQNSTYQKDRNGNQGMDLGWIGLLGLAGLFGLRRGRGALEEPEEQPTVAPHVHQRT